MKKIMKLINLKKQSAIFSIALSALLLAACSGESSQSTSEAASEAALDKDTTLAYVQRSVNQAATDDLNRFEQARTSDDQTPLELYSPYRFNPGARLYERTGLDVDAISRELLSQFFGTSGYDVKDLNVSADGRYLLFAAHGPEDHPTDNTWNIYEYDFESKSLRRIITDDTLANAGQDTNPTYTLDGTIIFSSDRAAGNPNSPVVNVVPVEDEEYCYKIYPEDTPSLLHSMTRQGSDILQLTYGNNHDTHPTTLKDGNVAFVRWSYTYEVIEECPLPLSRNESSKTLLKATTDSPWGLRTPSEWPLTTQCEYAETTPVAQVIAKNNYTLLRITPDGSDIDQLYDTVSINSSDEEFVFLDRIVQSENGEITAVLKHKFNDNMGGELLALGNPSQTSSDKVFGNMSPRSLVEGEAGLYPGQRSETGWYSAVWPYRDGSSRLLVSWSQCIVTEGGISSFCDNVLGDNDNSKYGLWLYDPVAKKRAPVVKANADVLFEDVVLSRPHTGANFPYQPFNADYVDNLDDAQVVCNYPPPQNQVPIANAGPDQSVYTGNLALLDGSASSDADGDTLTYYWQLVSQPGGSTAVLDNATSVAPSLTPDVDGTYEITLVVNDGMVASVADSVTITASTPNDNNPPIANAGPDQQVLLNANVILDGSASTDPEGSPITYYWQLVSQPAGSAITLIDSSTVSPSFTATHSGSYTLALVVNDGLLNSAPDTVVVLVNTSEVTNQPPVANAGPDQTLTSSSLVGLDGSGSSDPDGDSITYFWSLVSQPVGSSVVLSDTTSVNPSFTPVALGDYIISLTVNDGYLDSAPDLVVITLADGSSNQPPVANSGTISFYQTGQVTLNASGIDPEGAALSYRWLMSGSVVSTSQSFSLPVEKDNNYSLELIVNDGSLDSQPAPWTVIYVNQPPVAAFDVMVSEDGVVELISTSTDANGDNLSYLWELTPPADSDSTLADVYSNSTYFVADETGNYPVSLTVTDDGGLSDTATQVIEVTLPLVCVSDEQVTAYGAVSHLWVTYGRVEIQSNSGDRTDYDLLGSPVTVDLLEYQVQRADFLDAYLSGLATGDYSWIRLHDVSVKAVFENGDEMNLPIPSGDQTGLKLSGGFTLADDGLANFALDSKIIAAGNKLRPTVHIIPLSGVCNQAPTANAGDDQGVEVGQTANLDGSGSFDPNGQPLTYLWSLLSQPDGSSAQLTNASAVAPGLTTDLAGVYEIQLTVNDGRLDSVPDVVRVSAKELIDEDDVTVTCNSFPRQQASIPLSFPATRQTFPAGAEGQCQWQYTSNQGDNFIQGQYRQTVKPELPEGALVCASTIVASSGNNVQWIYDDEFYLTLGNKVLASSEKASIMENLVEPDTTLPYGEGPYVYNFAGIHDLAYVYSEERYCLGHPRVWDVDDVSQMNPQCEFPRTQNAGPFNIDIPQAAFAGVSANIVNTGNTEFSLIITGDNDNAIDCQHSGIELNWNIEYVVPE